MKINSYFLSYLAHFFSEWEMFQTKVVQKIKTHILFSVTVFLKSFRLWENVEKTYCTAGQATGACALHAGYIRLQTHTHTCCITLIAFYTMFARTRLNVTLYVPCLSCLLYFSILQCTSHPPISMADLRWGINYAKTLKPPCLNNLCVLNFALGEGVTWSAPMAYRVQLINYIQHNTSSKVISPQLLKNFTTFMDPKVSSPPSQRTCQSDLLNIYFNIILPSIPRSSKWLLSLRFPHAKKKNHKRLSCPPYVLHATPISYFLI